MADKNLVVQLLITAKDQASKIFRQLFGYLDDNTKVISGKIRDAFTNLFGGGIKSASEFEAQMDRVISKGDETYQSYDGLGDKIKAVGAQFGQSGTESAKAMESLAAAGVSATDAIAALPQVLALASAEQISADAAAQKLVDSLSVMGLGFDQAGRMADVLAKGANITTSTAAQLAEALSEAGGAAKQSGMDLETTVAALDLLHKNGLKGSEAGTALKAILTELQDPSSRASRELNKLGITSRNLGDVLVGLQANGSKANQAILAFGDVAGPGLAALMKEGKAGLEDFTGQLNAAEGAALGAAETMSGNLKAVMDTLAATWGNLKAALLEPALEPLAAAAKDAGKALNDALGSAAMKKVQEAIRAFVTEGVAAARDFLARFDLADAVKKISEFASAAKEAFAGMRDAGVIAADVVSVAWNSLAAGFRVIGAVIVEVSASAVQTLANIKAAASLVGLGTMERAKELTATALSLQQNAVDILSGVVKNAERIKNVFKDLTGATANLEARQAGLQRALDVANTAIDQGKITLKNAIAAYELAASKGENLAGAQQTLKGATDNYRIALDAQRIIQIALNDALNGSNAGMERLKKETDAATSGVTDLAPATQAAADSVREIAWAQQEGAPARKEYLDGVNYLVKGHTDLAAGAPAVAAGQDTVNKALLDGAGATEKQKDKLTQLNEEIARSKQASDAWRPGLDLNVISLNSMGDVADLADQKLAILQQRQRAGEKLDREVAVATAESQQARSRYTQALDDYVIQQDRAIDAARRANQLEAQSKDIDIQRAQATLELARIKGDVNEISRAENDLLDKTLDKIDAQIAGMDREIKAYQASIEATRIKLAASEGLDAADKDLLANMENKLEAMKLEQQALRETSAQLREKSDAERQAAEAANAVAKAAAEQKERIEQLAAQTDIVNSTLKGWNDRLKKLSPQLAETFDLWVIGAQDATEGMSELDTIIKKHEELVQDLSASTGAGMAGYLNNIARKAAELEGAWISQAKQAEQFIKQLDQIGEGGQATGESLEYLIRQAKAGVTSFDLLDQQRLNNLQSAIDQATEKLKDMQQETEDARARLAELNAELLEAQGMDEKAARLRQELDYQQQLAEIEKQRQEAQATGDAELLRILQEQQATLSAINKIKLANIEADEIAQTTNQPAIPVITQPTSFGKVYNLNLTANGKTLPTTTTIDPNDFLSTIERSQRASA